MKLTNILLDTGVPIPEEMKDLEITSIEDDSRRTGSGSLFIAIKGFETDGHLFAEQALERGASAVIAEREMSSDKRVLVNPMGDNRGLLSAAAARFYEFPWNDLLTVGITGTNGKTSTVQMLSWILSHQGLQCGLIGTIGHLVGGNEIAAFTTTPGSLETTRLISRMKAAGDSCCIMEVSSHALSQERVESVRYDIGVFTNISQDHLDYHESMEDYLQCKKHLFDLIKENGSSVVGTYSPGYPLIDGAFTFGDSNSDTYMISEISADLGKVSFVLNCESGSFPVLMNVPGRFNVYNAAGAIAAADRLGFDLSASVESLALFPGVPGRFEPVDLGQDFLVAVDYAHTPDALMRVLKQAVDLTENRVITVFGAGGDRDRRKRPVMGSIAAGISALTFVTSDNPRTEDPDSIISDILEGIPQGAGGIVRIEPDRRKAIRSAIAEARPGDVVVIAGKGHENYQILGHRKVHFDDREEVAAALREVLDR